MLQQKKSSIMQHLVFLLTISLLLMSCGQNETKQKELELKERELNLKEKELKLKLNDTTTSSIKNSNANNSEGNNLYANCEILNKWLSSIGVKATIDTTTLKKARLNVSNYVSAPNFKPAYYESGIERYSKPPKISVKSDYIFLDFRNDEEDALHIFLGNNLVVKTYAAGFGTARGSSVYYLVNKATKDYSYYIPNIKGNIADISITGIDTEIDEQTGELSGGRYWQEGKLNIETGKVTWGKKEY